jgi:hypothetical protein
VPGVDPASGKGLIEVTEPTSGGAAPAEPPVDRPAPEQTGTGAAECDEPEVVLHAVAEESDERPWCIGDLTV